MKLPVKPFFFQFGLFLLVLVLFIFFKPVIAQDTNPATPQASTDYAAPNTNSDVPNNLHTYTQNVLIETMAAVACQLTGVDPTTADHRCLGNDPVTGKIGYVDGTGGAVGFTSNMIGMLYTPPASSADYIKHMAGNFGIAKPAAAIPLDDGRTTRPRTEEPKTTHSDFTAGTGFEGIKPLLPVWEAFRDIVYLLFILVFIVIGVAIMLRLKIDPRSVMTIQNQIPKVIVGLLLVTFSFAIAGFLIDIMWVAIYLVYGVFSTIPGVDVVALSPQNLVGATPLGAAGGLKEIGSIAFDGAEAISPVLDGLFNNLFGGWLGGVLNSIFGGFSSGSLIATGIGAVVGGLIAAPTVVATPIGIAAGAAAGNIIGGALGLGGGGGGGPVGFLGGIIAFLIIAIALLWALVRIWFALIMAYISILLDIVFAPFWILGGLIPGSTLNFSAWIRDLVANLAAFPATIVILLLGKVFMDTMGDSQAPQFVPPLIGNPANVNAFKSIIGIGVFLTIPTALTMMKSALKAPKLDFSSVNQGVAAGARTLTGGVSTAIGIRQSAKEGVYKEVQVAGEKAQVKLQPRGFGGAIAKLFTGSKQ